ncbi:MAG TPA: cell division protein FtsQ/DivIB [Solirubrobacterales bacterium]|nr:cell division protein FtsQ/DivIB [Solirubrobacterales bacterium]
MKRRLLIALAVLALAAGGYLFLVRDSTVAPTLVPVEPTSVIGSGGDAVGVDPDGRLLTWLPAPEEGTLPRLPAPKAPEGQSRLAGPMLEQAVVLGATPPALRPYVERSYYGESGVDVVLDSGIELRFGNSAQASRKWRAAATLLADPAITALDSIDLHAPGRPSYEGSSHSRPPVP